MNGLTIGTSLVLVLFVAILIGQNYYISKENKRVNDLDDMIICDAMLLSISASKTYDAMTALLQTREAIVKLETLMSIRGYTSYTVDKTLLVLFHQQRQIHSVMVPNEHPLHKEFAGSMNREYPPANT